MWMCRYAEAKEHTHTHHSCTSDRPTQSHHCSYQSERLTRAWNGTHLGARYKLNMQRQSPPYFLSTAWLFVCDKLKYIHFFIYTFSIYISLSSQCPLRPLIWPQSWSRRCRRPAARKSYSCSWHWPWAERRARRWGSRTEHILFIYFFCFLAHTQSAHTGENKTVR